MKKQLFLSVMLLAVSAEMLARVYGGSGAGTPSRVPSSQPAPTGGGGTTPPPANGGGQPAPSSQGTSSAAAKAAQGLSAVEAIKSAMEALGVKTADLSGVPADPKAVNFIKTGQA